MKFTITLLLLLVCLSPKAFSQQTSSRSVAKRLIEQSIEAMGNRWDSVKSVLFDGYTSDLYQGSDGKRKYWDPQIVWEVYHSIKSRKIEVQQFYSTHSRGLLAFKDFEKDVISGLE